MKIVTFFYLTVWDSSILIRFGRKGEVMKFVTFFYLTVWEVPPFWSDMGEGWGDGEVILSGCLRRFLHSDQIWGEVMKIVTFFYLTVWDSSILIRFEVRWWKSWPFSIWLFEIPPFWSSEVMKIVTCFLSDCLGSDFGPILLCLIKVNIDVLLFVLSIIFTENLTLDYGPISMR